MNDENLSATTWRLGSAALITAFAMDPLGNLPNVAVLAVLFVAGLQVLITKPVGDRSNVALLLLASVIVAIASLEVLNPNVPSLEVGLVGFRKSATFVLGVVIGLGWRGSRMRGLRLAWWCMFLVGALSLVVHLAFPSVEKLVSRGAGEYTSMLSGIERMQGMLAGPFHVSLLGAFLVVSALAPGLVIRKGSLRAVAAAVGMGCVYFSQVRTGLVAVAVGTLVMAITTGSAKRWTNRILATAALLALAVIYINPLTEFVRLNTAVASLLDRGLQDRRFTGRFETWQTSIDLIDRSPFFGWGSGSAGDTLGVSFAAGQHVTAHNVFLKYAVEGGVVQGLLFIALCVGLLLAVRPRRDATRFGLAAAVPLLVFGLLGSAVESLPVSLGLAVIWGLCAGKSHTNLGPVEGTRAGFARSALANNASRSEPDFCEVKT
jgi:O-antigen ligase